MPPTEGVPPELSREAFTPEQVLLGHERTHRLVQAVRQLELPYRQVMTLLLEDLSYIEIGETLGISGHIAIFLPELVGAFECHQVSSSASDNACMPDEFIGLQTDS
jgi:hypothetical protein